MGKSNCGHWYLNVVRWSNNTGKGWTIDSLKDNNSNEKIYTRNRIKRIFGNNSIITWEEPSCVAQEELECGPRMLWGIHILSKSNGTREDTESRITSIAQLHDFSGNNSADEVRNRISNIYRNSLASTMRNNNDAEAIVIL